MKKILLIAADISDNCMGRAVLLAEMLSEQNRVEIAGTGSRQHLWKPLEGETRISINHLGTPPVHALFGMSTLSAHIYNHPAEILYVLKPRLHHLAAALIARRGRKILLDIDDWESLSAENASGSSLTSMLARCGVSFTHLAEKLVPAADAITVSNRYLQERFGGTVIPHARPAAFAKDENFSRQAACNRFAIPADKKLVLFLGTPQAHKGISMLAEAMATLAEHHPELHLVAAGLDPALPASIKAKVMLEQMLPGAHSVIASVPWNIRHELLLASDILVIPQLCNSFTEKGQSPAKLIDAMAAGKPIIASDISDIAQTLAGTGYLFPPGNVAALANSIRYMLQKPEEAAALAASARKKFVEHFSYEHVAPELNRLANSLATRKNE